MSGPERARAALAAWEAARPANVYAADPLLRALLARRLGPEGLRTVEPTLQQAGADAAGPASRLAAELDRPEHHPRLEAWDRFGRARAEVVFHPAYHELGRLVWRSGILAVLEVPGQVTLHLALAYLFAYNGEVPHLCPVACTAGLVKALQRAGEDWMRREWLPRLLERDYDRRWHAAQFLTEVQGGSDVGANACRAVPEPGGRAWRLYGEKWFCSNVGADLYAVSARPDGAPAGTAGLRLFVVPRLGPDDRPNGLVIRRLKDKLGTRSLPTAEVEFAGALAYPLGTPEESLRLLLGVIINTSRTHVAAGTAGIMHRAWVEASTYAAVREAFGCRLRDFPAVRQQLAGMRTRAAGALAAVLFVGGLEDDLTVAGLPPEDDPVFRTAVNLVKYRCAADAARVVHDALEILGGNGLIEDFGPLPRLYREVPVQEAWEGPHNTLMAQILRDGCRAKLHEPFLERLRARLLAVTAPGLAALRERGLAVLEDLSRRLGRLLRHEDEAGYHVRRVVGRLGRLLQAVLLLEPAAAGQGPAWLPAAAGLLLADAARDRDPMDDPEHASRIAQLVEG